MTEERKVQSATLSVDPVLADAIGALSGEISDGIIAPSAGPGEVQTPFMRFKELERVTEPYLTEEASAMLKKAYKHDSVITRKTLPDLKAYPLRDEQGLDGE